MCTVMLYYLFPQLLGPAAASERVDEDEEGGGAGGRNQPGQAALPPGHHLHRNQLFSNSFLNLKFP